MAIPDFQTYSELIYSLPERYNCIKISKLVLAPIGPNLAKVEGQIIFEQDVILDVWELVDFEAINYSYDIIKLRRLIRAWKIILISSAQTRHAWNLYILMDLYYNLNKRHRKSWNGWVFVEHPTPL